LIPRIPRTQRGINKVSTRRNQAFPRRNYRSRHRFPKTVTPK